MVVELRRKLGGAGFVAVATLTFLTLQIEPSAAASICANLTGFSLPKTKVTLARSYRAGEMVARVTKAPTGLRRVAGTSKPSSDSNINFGERSRASCERVRGQALRRMRAKILGSVHIKLRAHPT